MPIDPKTITVFLDSGPTGQNRAATQLPWPNRSGAHHSRFPQVLHRLRNLGTEGNEPWPRSSASVAAPAANPEIRSRVQPAAAVQ
jgi:hypothetical protein